MDTCQDMNENKTEQKRSEGNGEYKPDYIVKIVQNKIVMANLKLLFYLLLDVI